MVASQDKDPELINNPVILGLTDQKTRLWWYGCFDFSSRSSFIIAASCLFIAEDFAFLVRT